MAASLVYCSCPGFCPWSLCFKYYLLKQSLQNHKPDWVTTLCATDHLLTHWEHQVPTAISHSDPVPTAFPSTCSAPYSIPQTLGWVRQALSSERSTATETQHHHLYLGHSVLFQSSVTLLTGGHGSVWNPHYLEECLAHSGHTLIICGLPQWVIYNKCVPFCAVWG